MIRIQNLQKVQDQRTVLNIDTLQVDSHQIAALVGPADSGKEVLLELLLGKTAPTMGSISVGGIDPLTDREAFSRSVGVLFAADALYNTRTAAANLEFYCQLYGIPKSNARLTLAIIGLADQADTRVDKLSSGLLRRLAFGRAILHDPQVLILEEPFARCDEASLQILSSVIRDKAEAGAAILILAEEAGSLPLLCGVIYTLNQGRIIETRRPQEGESPALPLKIPVRLEGRVALVNPADILYVLAEGGKTYLQTQAERLPTHFSLSELEERLVRRGFFRAHRSYLVNLQHVTEVIPFTRDSFSLRLDDTAASLVPLSKQAASELKELLGY